MGEADATDDDDDELEREVERQVQREADDVSQLVRTGQWVHKRRFKRNERAVSEALQAMRSKPTIAWKQERAAG